LPIEKFAALSFDDLTSGLAKFPRVIRHNVTPVHQFGIFNPQEGAGPKNLGTGPIEESGVDLRGDSIPKISI